MGCCIPAQLGGTRENPTHFAASITSQQQWEKAAGGQFRPDMGRHRHETLWHEAGDSPGALSLRHSIHTHSTGMLQSPVPRQDTPRSLSGLRTPTGATPPGHPPARSSSARSALLTSGQTLHKFPLEVKPHNRTWWCSASWHTRRRCTLGKSGSQK